MTPLRMRRHALHVAAVACLLAASVPARAQVGGAALTGVVRDASGGAVPGATVTVTDTATNRERVVVSSGDGVYAAAGLAPGVYRVDVQLSGFRPVRRDGVRLETGETARI